MMSEKEERFLRFAVMESIASSPVLNRRLILRSAAAIRHFYSGPRRTSDLDFVLVRNNQNENDLDEPNHTHLMLNDRLNERLPLHYSDYANQVGWITRELQIEISPCNEPVECRAIEIVLGSGNSILVSTLEDAVAGKLVAILDYHAGGKLRERDLFDVAEVVSRAGNPVNVGKVLELAHAKAKKRGFEFTPAVYNDDVRWRLSFRYHTIRELTGDAFIPFEDAWNKLQQVVGV